MSVFFCQKRYNKHSILSISNIERNNSIIQKLLKNITNKGNF